MGEELIAACHAAAGNVKHAGCLAVDGFDQEINVGGNRGWRSKLVGACNKGFAGSCSIKCVFYLSAVDAVYPGRADDEVVGRGVAHHYLACALRLSIRGFGVGRVEFIGGFRHAYGEHVVC